MKKYFKNKSLLISILVFIACIPLIPFLSPGMPITHDGLDHVARIANFYQSLSEGNIVPRWAPNLDWGYGYPILMFLYPLPSYMASFFHFLGFSFIDSTKIIFTLGFLASGFTMFLWIRSMFGVSAGIFAAFLYMLAPYRFVDLYVRGALGEHVAFIFAPLVFYYVHKLFKEDKKISLLIFGSVSLTLLILSHNAISLMFLPLIFGNMLWYIWRTKHKKQLIVSYVLFSLFGFGLSAFFWFPAFLEGKYTHRDILTSNVYATRFSSLSRFFHSPWSYEGTGKLSVEVGKIQWLVVLIGIPISAFLIHKKRLLGVFLLLTLCVFFFSIFLMHASSALLWDKVTILQKFQFPWRFLTLSVFVIAVAGGVIVAILPKGFQIQTVMLGIILLVLFNKDYWQANGYFYKTDKFFSAIYSGTTDTGESSPRWGVSYMKKAPKVHLDVISGKATIIEKERFSTKHVYEVSSLTTSQLRENTLYFPGWEVFVNGKKVDTEFQARNNMGVMTFFVPEGKHTVRVEFGTTKIRRVGEAMSVITIICMIFFLKPLYASRQLK